jgi:hypothetical protein
LIFEQAEQLEIEEDELHRGIADPFADAERGAVHAVGAELEGPQRVFERETAVVVTVPIDAHLSARLFDDLLGKADQVAHTVRRGVAHGIRDAEAARAMIDGHFE